MLEVIEKSRCSGCGMCQNICPVKAIYMLEDEDGFLYPKVDCKRCIKCGKCEHRCPLNLKTPSQNEKRIAYAAQTKNEEIRQKSSSGGIFSEIAFFVLLRGGVVFGATFDKNFKVVHIGVEHIEELKALRGAKYVQSEIRDAYTQVKQYLDAGRLVLFSGTPCQVSGLYGFLGKKYYNLYTQDIICHGVPSPMVWNKYIEYREAKANAKLRMAYFRNKRYGWKSYSVHLEFANYTEYTQRASEDLYMRCFLNNLCLRPSCYNCAFKTINRDSDLTLADFWGIDKMYPELNDDKGISLVILHSEKGEQLFENLKDAIIWQRVDFEMAIQNNPSFCSSAIPNTCKTEFIRCIKEKGFRVASKKYLTPPLKNRITRTVKTALKKYENVRKSLFNK